MFRYHETVHLQDTDATGVIYFSNQLKFALQAFEEFLKPSPFSLKDLMNSAYLIPIVNVEANYFSPLTVDDDLEVILILERIGASSFTIKYDFFNVTSGKHAGDAKITHVVTLKETQRSTPIPSDLRVILSSLLPTAEGCSC